MPQGDIYRQSVNRTETERLCMAPPTLTDFLTRIWAELGDFTHPRAGYPGLVSLATIGNQCPELRQLVLRSTDKASGRVMLHSDTETAKCREILANPNVSLLAWRAETNLQIRLKGVAEILGSYAATSVWSELPFASRGNYGVTPAPGTPIAEPHAYQRNADMTRLAVIAVQVTEIDAVELREPNHIRALYRAADNWSGSWLAP